MYGLPTHAKVFVLFKIMHKAKWIVKLSCIAPTFLYPHSPTGSNLACLPIIYFYFPYKYSSEVAEYIRMPASKRIESCTLFRLSLKRSNGGKNFDRNQSLSKNTWQHFVFFLCAIKMTLWAVRQTLYYFTFIFRVSLLIHQTWVVFFVEKLLS